MSEKDTSGENASKCAEVGLATDRRQEPCTGTSVLLWLRGKAYNTELLNTTAVSLSPSEKTTSHI